MPITIRKEIIVMGEKVNTKNPNLLYINKIGKNINLAKLDKLVGTSTKGSIFKDYDKKSYGGNSNHVFEQYEVDAIKRALIAKSQKEEDISKNDLKMLNELAQDVEAPENEQDFEEEKTKTKENALPEQETSSNTEPVAETITEDENNPATKRKDEEALITDDNNPAPLIKSEPKSTVGNNAENTRNTEVKPTPDNEDETVAHNENDNANSGSQPEGVLTNPKGTAGTSDDIVILAQHRSASSSKTKVSDPVAKKSTKVSAKKQPTTYPKNVQDKLTYLKKYGESCDVQFKNGRYTITAKGGPLKSKFQTNYMTYNYDSKGNLIAQYKVKTDGSVDKGVYNKQTNQIEYKQYKNTKGILQQIPANVQKRANDLKAAGGEAVIIKGKSTFTIKQTKGSYLTQHNIKSIEIKYSPNGQLIEQITTRNSGEVDKTTFKNNTKVSTKAVKSANSVPDNVMKQYNNLKAQVGDGVQLKKNGDGTFTVYENDNKMSYMTKNKLRSISYVYSHEGKLLYQLNALQDSEQVLKGVYNPKTKKTEYSVYKNSNGILQQIPDSVKQKRQEMQQDGCRADLIKGKSTFVIVQSSGQYLQKNDIAKIEHKYSPQGKLIQQVYTYKNGRVLTYYDAASHGTDAAHAPNPISLKLPAQYQDTDSSGIQMVYGLETKGPKDTAQRFSKALSSNKAKLMKQLGLTNEEYDNLAVLSMGIAEQETHFGQSRYVDTSGEKHTQLRAIKKEVANTFVWSEKEQMQHSQGITQIRYASAIKDPIVAKRFKQNGINSFQDFLKSPEKQAIATMILLNENRKVASGATWQKRLQQNNAKIKNPQDKLTTNDITVLLWNGASGPVKRMKAGETITINSTTTQDQDGNDLNGMHYSKNVRTYSDKFYATPENGKAGATHLTKNTMQAGATGGDGQQNGGQLGEVVFMPRSYSNSGRTASSAKQTQEALAYIDANTRLSQNSKNILKGYVRDGIIGFGNQGLTKTEALSINENDLKLMQKQVSDIKLGKVTPNQANTNFETAYLKSRQFTVKNSAVSSASILRQTTSSNPKNDMLGGISFDVPSAFYNGKEHSARYTSFNSGANSNVFATTKSQGVNPYLSNGTKVDTKYRVAAEHAQYTATHVLESGGRCKTGVSVDLEYSMGIDHTKIRGKGGKSIPSAKQMTEFYNAHPEVFTQVKYVDNGDGTSREINATDVHNLPCGYYGVFVPGKGYEKEHGHAFVSDGFGGCNADEHDNGNWAHFGNGKGEHGQLKVYGLSNSVVSVYSKKLGRTVNVPLNINPWYLTPEFRELQTQIRKQKGLSPLTPKKEFDV